MAEWDKQHKEARSRLRLGNGEQALASYLLLLSQVDVPVASYDVWVAEAERAARLLPVPLPAAYLALYRRDLIALHELLPIERFPLEHAHALALAEDPEPARAARLFEAAGRLVLAARAYAAARDRKNAARCYRLLLSGSNLSAYEQALLHVQLAVLLQKTGQDDEERAGKRHAAAAQQLLEALADEYEGAGELERALDCYRLYIELGRARGSFENIVEGYVSCLRILKDERHTLEALDHYESLIGYCRQRGEHHLAAAECREAAEYIERLGLPAERAVLYRRLAAEEMLLQAARNKEHGGPLELSESALLQAAFAFNAVCDFAGVRATFEKLAALPLSAEQRQRYKHLAGRLAAAPVPPEPAPVVAAPALAAAKVQSEPAVWDLDLVEWQAAGDPAAVCLALLADRTRPQLTRRHALLVLLSIGLPKKADPEAAVASQRLLERQRRIIASLAGLRCYEALRPLERLFDESSARGLEPAIGSSFSASGASQSVANPTPAVNLRRAIVQALPRLPFRRAVSLMIRGLADSDPVVYSASLEGLAGAHFPEAVSSLLRLYRAQALLTAPPRAVLEVQRAILYALGRSRDPRAKELLLDVSRRGLEPLRSDAQRSLQAAFSDDTRPG